MIVRLGQRRVLCATIEGGHQRFAGVHAALAADRDPCKINLRIAALAQHDGAAGLVEPADSDLPNRRAE